MKPNIYKQALLRIPAFSISATLPEHWESLKISISESSPEFYRIIEHTTKEQLGTLPPAIRFTIWKYFNRSKYRPVPYGSFAGIANIEIAKRERQVVRIADQQVIHRFVDWTEKADEIPDHDYEQLFLFTNSSHYRVGEEIRYLSFFDEHYQLSAIDATWYINKVLQLCRHPHRYSLVVDILLNHEMKEFQAIRFIQDLLSFQLLISSRQPNIIGADYFKRELTEPKDLKHYLIAERAIASGTIDAQRLRHIPALVSLLAGLSKPFTSPALSGFMEAFVRRYGEMEIPLMLALDPECGIGYGGQGDGEDPNSLVAKLKQLHPKEARQHGFSSLITEHFHSVLTGAVASIDLEQISNFQERESILPNSMSVLLTMGDGLVYAESIGGCTATALMGRFTLGSEAIQKQCRDIVAMETAANPDVLFFDIGYTAEKLVDNINRREEIYPYQLNILNYDTSAEPLCLTDLVVSVRDNSVILKCGRFNKRLIPRMASAYNYNRSDLAVFRFLCDLQSHGLHTNLSIDLQEIIPGLSHYPRLYYKDIVLSPAKWKISQADQIESLATGRYFLAGNSDQTLCFDRNNEADLQMFKHFLARHKTTYIREAFIDSDSQLRDSQHSPYHGQLLLHLLHEEQIYQGLNSRPAIHFSDYPAQLIPPGHEWLYFEIYCQPRVAEQLLIAAVADLLEQCAQGIMKWFFIRYTENGHHIRLRIQLRDPMFSQPLTARLSRLLKDELHSGKVSNLLLNTYKRESQRYVGADIAVIESHFCADSIFVLSILSSQLSDLQKYQLCQDLIRDIRTAALFNDEALEELIREISEGYNAEYKASTLDFKLINQVYRQYRDEDVSRKLSKLQRTNYKQLQKSFVSVLGACEERLRGRLFSDLMHMHFNRLFSTSQRLHEMIFYNLLLKSYKTVAYVRARC